MNNFSCIGKIMLYLSEDLDKLGGCCRDGELLECLLWLKHLAGSGDGSDVWVSAGFGLARLGTVSNIWEMNL